jgi:hypothetical protein
MENNDDTIKRRTEFAEAKRKRRAAECLSIEDQLKRAKEVLSSPGSKAFFKKMSSK